MREFLMSFAGRNDRKAHREFAHWVVFFKINLHHSFFAKNGRPHGDIPFTANLNRIFFFIWYLLTDMHLHFSQRIFSMGISHFIECTSSCVYNFAKEVSATAAHMYKSTQVFFEKNGPDFAKKLEKVQKVVLPILCILGAGILLAAQSSMFAIGFLVSIMNPKIIEGSLDRISKIWHKQHFLTRTAIVIGAIISWPISLAASAFFAGGNIGLSLVPSENPSPPV
jgi:hypothetical protein